MKNVLITGGSGDLGKSIAYKIAEQLKNNCLIILHYNSNKAKAEQVANEIKDKYGCKTDIINANFKDIKSVEKMVSTIIERFGGVDILINNAAMVVDADVSERTAQIFEETLRCNLVVPFYLSKTFGSLMNKKGYGKIVNISSTNGIDYNSPYSMDYDASKAGLNSLTKNLAITFNNVNINCVCPHWMDTQMNADLEPDFLEKEASKIIKGRFAKTSEVAELIWFLISDNAEYLTGQIYSFGSYKY